ncbi:chymotrypsin inhibitor isoform X2 [Cephus cinctus]|uniref:Chymotrypsin inhibitor isoform X2 n=1 Tax=Cephus cinctus TaxID=211228 RepID=A0AAJ7BWP2_CEPCN|nr:chymotrypsin inhibitor isoform X2 [Cephus cinctus]
MSRIVKVILIVAIIYYSEAQVTGQNCEENQEWTNCGSACEPSCENPNPQICTFNCIIGCRCKSGFLRDANRNCVTQENCPTD